MSNFNIFVNLKLHVCLLGINAHLIFHTYKNETAFYLLENLCQMFQMRNSTIIGFKNMVSKIHGYCILCNQKMFCHLCWSTNNFQVGHWRNLCLTLPTKQKKKYQYSKHSSEFFWLLSVRNFFSQGIYKSNPLTFLWEKNWAFWKSYIKPNLWQIVIWSKSVWHPKWQKNWSKNWKKKKKMKLLTYNVVRSIPQFSLLSATPISNRD